MKQLVARTAVGLLVALSALGAAEMPLVRQVSASAPARMPGSPASVDVGPPLVPEREPNNTPGAAMPLGGQYATVKGYIFPSGDVDYFSFEGGVGDRVYAALMTAGSSNGSSDSLLSLIGIDGISVIETDDNDGSLGENASSIAGAVLPATGTYFLRVSHPIVSSALRPYVLYVRVMAGAPMAETEPNGTDGTANSLPANGWVSGIVSATTDADWFSLTLAAGDTVFLSLDPNPERDHITWNPQLRFGLFDQIPVVNDAGMTTENSEALFLTVKKAGVYYPVVLHSEPMTPSTYYLSASVFPRPAEICTTYNSDSSVALPPLSTSESAISVGDGSRIGRLRVTLNLTHTNLPDLDVMLRDPQGDEIGLFTDVSSDATFIFDVDMTLDDDAAVPLDSFSSKKNLVYRPAKEYLLGWDEGQPRRGTWELVVRSDGVAGYGVLQDWALEICEPPPPVCGPESLCATVYSTTFESGADGFVMAGVQNEWARGLPSAYPITSCQSGSNCFKTDLDGTYNASSSQDLFSPPISLTGYLSPALASWGMKYSLEGATYDHASVEIQEVGGSFLTRTLWMHYGQTMSVNVGGAPGVDIQEAAGWGVHNRDISDFVGKVIRLRFHLDSDSSVNLSGMAIDDVVVRAMPRLVYLPQMLR